MHTIEVQSDECDACPADAHVQAYVYVELRNGGTVSYCAHHGTEYMPRLHELEATIIDLRHTVQ